MFRRLREQWQNWRRPPGLNTPDEATAFVAAIGAAKGVLAEPEPVVVPEEPQRSYLDTRTPVFDAVWAEHLARLSAEVVAERFAEVVAQWRCLGCEAGEHRDCPGCTCPCSSPELLHAG